MSQIRSLRLLLVLLASTALLAVAAAPFVRAQDAAVNGAGLVVRHGDGSLIYAYVEFEGETISGEDLLLQSGLDFVIAPYSGLGTGICAINGEGCSADNCYCESYDNPAYFWQYYGWNGGGWTAHLQGPTSRQLEDGDIDGWSWTAGDHGLPPVTIDEIAAITGFDRGPQPTETPPPTSTEVPTETPTTAPPPTPTPEIQPTDTPPPAPTETETPAPSATATNPPATTPTATAPPTASATATATTARTATPTASQPATEAPAPTASPTASPAPNPTDGAGAVIVRPGATPSPVETRTADSGDSQQNLLLFGGFAVIIVSVGVFVLLRNRQGGG